MFSFNKSDPASISVDLTTADAVTVSGGAGQTADVKITLDSETVGLAAGTNAIGKLASNSGVDIGDVDILSIAAGDNNIGNVDIVTLPALVAGTAAIGKLVSNSGVDIGDVDILSIAAGDNNIGNVDIASIAAGDNNIGNVDVLTIAAGDNNIGNVDIVTLPALVAGTANIGDVDVLSLPATPAGTNLIGAISASCETATVYSGTTALTPKFAVIDAATSGDNTIVAAVASKKIRVLSVYLVASAAVTARFESGAAGTALSGQMQLGANGGFVLPFSPVGHFETASATLLNLELSGAISVDGGLVYVEV